MTATTVIYLDQNKWIELARAASGAGSDSTKVVLEQLRTAVSDGRVVVPLSAAHYLETWHREKWCSRYDVGELMAEISQFATLSPVHHILCLEVESFLLGEFRDSCSCTAPDARKVILGRGVDHAFHSATGRLRLVEWTFDEKSGEGPPVPLDRGMRRLLDWARALPEDIYEWWSLLGFQGPMQKPGWEIRGEHRLGSDFMLAEHALASRFAVEPEMRRRMDDVLVAEEIATITDYINRTAWWHGIDIGRLTDRWMDGRAAYGHHIVDSLPTRRCIFEMRRAKHRNPQWKWSQHDLTDVKALAGVIPYVDAVVTERQWAHVFSTGGAKTRYGTKVLSRLADLSPWIT